MDDLERALKEAFEKATETYRSVNDYSIEIGVVEEKTKRKLATVGITNAQLMFIHENGSPLRNIPARPVLQMTLDYANKNLVEPTVDKCVKIILDNGPDEALVERELNKLAIKLENYARKIIYSNDGRLAPNAPSVAKAKGGNHPLFNTGQLARSITCRVVKEDTNA